MPAIAARAAMVIPRGPTLGADPREEGRRWGRPPWAKGKELTALSSLSTCSSAQSSGAGQSGRRRELRCP